MAPTVNPPQSVTSETHRRRRCLICRQPSANISDQPEVLIVLEDGSVRGGTLVMFGFRYAVPVVYVMTSIPDDLEN